MTDLLAAARRWVDQHHDPTSDADLLARFAAEQDAEAFERLVRRHGALVWAVCRRMLPADPDDAFQATFLALVRSAHRIGSDRTLGGWLHRAAVRVCLQARRTAARRAARERAAARPEATAADPDWAAAQSALHEEIERLPAPLRAAFVLCELQGVRPGSAAARLGWKAGTLTGRLCKARQMLQARLIARGLTPAVILSALVASETSGCPARLASAVLGVVPGSGQTVSETVLELARGATEATMGTMHKLLTGVALAIGLVAVSAGHWAPAVTGQDTPPPVPRAPRPGVPAGVPAPQANAPAGGKWEYKFVAQPVATVLPSTVAQYGEEGWELTTVLALTREEVRAAAKADPKRVLDAEGATNLFVFKRPSEVANSGRPTKVVPAPAVPIDPVGGGLQRR